MLVIILLAVTCVVFTMRNQARDQLRAHTIEVMRLSSVVEQDISALENAYRGHLLTRKGTYLESSAQLQQLFFTDSEDLTSVLAANSQQRKRILKMRENMQNWLAESSLSLATLIQNQSEPLAANTALNPRALGGARDILHAIQREEQIALNHRVREQEWATQSTQILNFIPKMQRAASDMQKEVRGFLLTGNPAFIDAYKSATSDFYAYQGYLSILLASESGEMKQLNHIRDHVENWITESAVPDIEAKQSGKEIVA
ncbi:MAG: CHASE3 domain-containing protein, partial [Verrucomicrobiota bacterium]|nr:CHASE3 domain-containing protein [Verrucomicrobiota bacterium]